MISRLIPEEAMLTHYPPGRSHKSLSRAYCFRARVRGQRPDSRALQQRLFLSWRIQQRLRRSRLPEKRRRNVCPSPFLVPPRILCLLLFLSRNSQFVHADFI